MLAVIFKAEIAKLDITELNSDYHTTAERLRKLALDEYGCTEFISFSEGNQELAISYWPSKDHIAAWHQNAEHVAAQAKGKSLWYKSYQVQITEVQKEYGAASTSNNTNNT